MLHNSRRVIGVLYVNGSVDLCVDSVQTGQTIETPRLCVCILQIICVPVWIY